jgi:hypothetical protein
MNINTYSYILDLTTYILIYGLENQEYGRENPLH